MSSLLEFVKSIFFTDVDVLIVREGTLSKKDVQ